MGTNKTLELLNHEMHARSVYRELYICGGAAFIALGITSRSTRDVDVLLPKLDDQLRKVANAIAEKLGLREGWLNNGPDDLLRYLESGWQERCSLVFAGQALKVFCLSRQELLNTKLWAACDRVEDVPDILQMRPTTEELTTAKNWVLKCDASPIWEEIVDQCLSHLIERLSDG